MTFSLPKEPINRQFILLICLFLAALAAIVGSQNIMQSKLDSINSLRKNELNRIEMSYLIHIELQQIQSLFQNMSLCRTEYELIFFDNQISTSIKKIQDFISVISVGGTTTYAYKVNFGNEEEIQRSFTYRNYQQNEVNLDTFELTSKVKDLEKHESRFKELIRQKINPSDIKQLSLIEQKIIFFYKGVDPYFRRIFENSYRIYFNAQTEMQRLHTLAAATAEKNTLQFRLILTITGLFMIGLTGMVLININRILRERNDFQEQLKLTNDNLEYTILERTWKLNEEVAERQKAEENEHQQAVFLKTIINSLAHPFYVVDVNTYEIKLMNDYARRLNPQHTRFCHTLTHNRPVPCDDQNHPCPLVGVKEHGQPVTMEHTHYNHAGEKTYVEVHGHPVVDVEGKVIQMIEYSLDVTQRKIAEMALEDAYKNLEVTVHERTASLEKEIEKRQKIQIYFQESEHYYRTLIESSNDLIAIIDATGTVTYASHSLKGMLGYAPEFIEGKNLYDYLHPDDIKFGKENFGSFLASLEPGKRLEHRVRARDGRYLVLESSFHNLLHDKIINGVLLTARDITAKREAEALMRKLQLVIEQSPNSVVITNKDGDIEYVNPQFEATTGYSRAEALTKNPRIFSSGLTPPETYQEMWKAISQGLIWHGEFINRKKNGEIYYENVVIAPLKNEYDKITHYVAMKENITELKKAREQADASNRAKSQFLSRMSHELRTPLNAINGFSKLLLDNKTHPLPPRQLKQVLQINTAGHYLLELINDILDLSRIEAGKLALSLESIAVAESVRNCLTLVESLALKNQVSIKVDASVADLPPVKADQTRFKQVILNLLSNGVKYNRLGGTVTITAKAIDGTAHIWIVDTGIGIAQDKQMEIFVPFTRLVKDNSTIEGTGIGMTITKQLLELMQGTISFTSTPGEGTAFCITLPLADHENRTEKQDSLITEQTETTSKAATILYIENKMDNIATLRKFMAQRPHWSLVIRKTVEKGIQSVEMLKPDIILLNINLLRSSGADSLLALQQDLEKRNIPVIAMDVDTLPDTDNKNKYRELDFHAYFTNPLELQKLHTIITTAFKEHIHDGKPPGNNEPT